MFGLTNFEVYISIFIITEEKIEFYLLIFPDLENGGITYEKMTNEIEKTWKFQLLEPPIHKVKQNVQMYLTILEKKYHKV